MKTCILAKFCHGEIGSIIDARPVGDEHQFGPDSRGDRIHIEYHGELEISRGKQHENGPELPLTIDGYPASALKVYADGVLSYPIPLRRRDPSEAAELIRAGYRKHGIPDDIAEAMIEAILNTDDT